MTFSQQKRPRRLGPLIAFLVVAVLTLLLIVGLLGARLLWPDDKDNPQSSATPTTPTTSKPVVRQDLKVAVGEGGSKTSPYDPSMHIGYEPTCEGAVEAATNYLVGLDVTKVTAGDLKKDKYLSLLKDRTSGNYSDRAVSESSELIDQSEGQETPRASLEPDWGGFSVQKCEEGESATIQTVYASSYDGKNYTYIASSSELQWVDDDWKLTGTGDAESPVDLPEQPVTEPDAQIVKLIGTQSQWENYADSQ